MRTLERRGFVARSARPDDVPQLAGVLAQAFPRWPAVEIDCTPAEHVEWKMGSPGTPLEHHTVVTEGERVVCLKLRWIGRALVDGVEVITDTGADFAALPAYQGRGLGRLLTDFEINGARPRGDLAMDLPPSNPVVRDSLHATEIEQHPLVAWHRPMTARATLATHRSRPTGLVSAAARALRRRERPASPGAIEITRVARFDERVDLLWEASRRGADFVRVRDARYLNWRHADPRSGRRLILAATEGDQLLGWLVLRPTSGAVSLVDILIHPNRPEAAAALLTEAARRGRSIGARSIDVWLSPRSSVEPVLAGAGFLRHPEPVTFELFRPRGGTGAPELIRRLGDPALKTYVTMGDFDFN